MNPLDKKVGILGGGQLGRMLIEAAHRLNVDVTIVDPQTDSPAKQLSNKSHIDKDFKRSDAIMELSNKVDVITAEIEHVDTKTLSEIVDMQISQSETLRAGNSVEMPVAQETSENSMHTFVLPSPKTIEVIQDKYLQHKVLFENKIPVAEFESCDDYEHAVNIGTRFSYPMILKARRGAYDGRGNVFVNSELELKEAWDKLSSNLVSSTGEEIKDSGIYAEKLISFTKELAVMVVKGIDDEIVCYPVVETVQSNNICNLVIAPAPINGLVREKAEKMACAAVKAITSVPTSVNLIVKNGEAPISIEKISKSAGVFGVELFLLDNGEVIVNEIAPRPHNSGHYTIEACETSQYENHLRSVLGLPLGSTKLKVNFAAMVNILGLPNIFNVPTHCYNSTEVMKSIVTDTLSVPGSTVHMYGKKEAKVDRKMGHVTIVANSPVELSQRLRAILYIVSGRNYNNVRPTQFKQILDLNTHSIENTHDYKPTPLVGIIMGSDSDLPVMKLAADQLKSFGVPFELTIVSAHRTPERMVEYAQSAKKRGLKVIIAGAGGAAHLPGMVAALTPLPVIGVPVKGRCLDGVDSLYSIVQMPRGIPVATVAINNADNAGLLAVRILGGTFDLYSNGMLDYMDRIRIEVEGKIEKLESVGYENY
ncbi:phosphoribosylaminoimidazole carboxylase [Smittium culicis]|uniref:Phosphoribosylaminoimidazole carboxylase n=1 Tax=Smittium culicis TaxID=133412 RepID=A0A1R1X3S4_9FUNG|nr:phosphoribosylaminoimidazole carboxylase [Smittium culicis]